MKLSFLGVGLIFIAVGAILLLGQLEVLDSGEVIGDWWPLALVWLAILQWLNHPRQFVGPLVLGVIGILLLGRTANLFDASVIVVVLAVGLVVIGGLIIRSAVQDRRVIRHEPTTLDSFVAFGGRELVSRADPFESASLASVFGGTELDLSEAVLSERGASISVVNVFGGTEITVPRDWRVELRISPILGGVADSTVFEPTPGGADRTLVVDGVAVLGGVEIKNPEKPSGGQ